MSLEMYHFTLTVSTLTGHYKMFFTEQFNKRMLCYETLKSDRIYIRSLSPINTAMYSLCGSACFPFKAIMLRGETLIRN